MNRMLKPGKNCWCLEKAEHIAFLVDGQAIFEAFEAAAGQARQSLLIVGWDIDSRVRMRRRRGQKDAFDTPTLGDFLEDLVASREQLQVHILIWDFPVIYAADRQPLPIFSLDWSTHPRIHFHLDDEHPIGACHHQKIIVIDDELAMVGGFDLSNRRWDTRQHRPADPRRTDPLGDPYPPFHDVQMLVQGPVAAKLGDLARQRWHRATEHRLPVPHPARKPVWPASVAADLHHMPVAIARTEPAYKNRPEIREVQRLFEDAVAAAERHIYIENQYLTSRVIHQRLLASLSQETGPEIVIILPKSNTGWLEQNTMGRLRRGLLQSLRENDRYGRLGVYYPIVQDNETQGQIEVRIHSKVMIVDDRFVRVGSANLNNRSMGLDTECDLAIECVTGEPGATGCTTLRNRLLAEHLGATQAQVEAAVAAGPSLLKAIEKLRGNAHTLEELMEAPLDEEDLNLPEIDLIDPERPIQIDRMMDRMLIAGEGGDDKVRSGTIKLVVAALLVLTLIGLWRFTPLKDYLDVSSLATWAESFRASPLAWLYVMLGYVVGGLLFFPVTVMIVATSLIFSPLPAFLCTMGGSLASAVLTYGLGHWLGRDTIRNVAGGRLNKISKQIARKGLIAVGTLRLVPIAPFTLINLVAGASHIRFRDYLLGTLLGMLPGIAGLTLLTDRLKATLVEPGIWNALWLLLLLLVLGLGVYYLKNRLSTTKQAAESADNED